MLRAVTPAPTDPAAVAGELKLLREIVRAAGRAYDDLPDSVRTGIERRADEDELLALTALLTGFSTATRHRLEETLSSTLQVFADAGITPADVPHRQLRLLRRSGRRGRRPPDLGHL